MTKNIHINKLELCRQNSVKIQNMSQCVPVCQSVLHSVPGNATQCPFATYFIQVQPCKLSICKNI